MLPMPPPKKTSKKFIYINLTLSIILLKMRAVIKPRTHPNTTSNGKCLPKYILLKETRKSQVTKVIFKRLLFDLNLSKKRVTIAVEFAACPETKPYKPPFSTTILHKLEISGSQQGLSLKNKFLKMCK